ncbi:class I SAM-dependent methyltransferase [Blastococcus sp. TF02A-30]|uniref:class I SAM-dependent methyltransferase n=1 Tax=Blastococcus sp. TF02A-30 TaxID=2250580 RepID=UPI0018F2A366|nr:class I SAM-dependent methyltransferase [Blastococcus sp. TF02A-30]
MRASERLTWASGIVAAGAGERVLEVGCGHGVLVSLLVGAGADVVGVDRSATMTAAAGRRNAQAMAAGRVRLVTASLTAADLGAAPFDAVVSFDVRAFWSPPAPEWDVVDRVLAPHGRVVVAFSLMTPDALDRVPAAIGRLAAERGLAVMTVLRAPTSPYESVAVELRRA